MNGSGTRYHLVVIALICVLAAAASDLRAAPPPVETPGWLDRDGDGRNDVFQDAQGDGINDVSGVPYARGFQWADEDNDGLNDVFRDADGDGVNDLESAFRDRDGDGFDDNVLDADRDGRNDVTGLAFSPGQLHGEVFGFINESKSVAEWIDEDGDGFVDEPNRGPHGRGRDDRFVDRDGDGMADGRWFEDGGFRLQRRRGSGGGHGGGHGGGGSR
jgi:hypothetical protein